MRLTELHVSCLPEAIPDPGPMQRERENPLPPTYHREMAKLLTDTWPGSDRWLFAYGSLIWKPRIGYLERRLATARGWHRDFCLGPDTRYRGNPLNPGYMLSLDRGGRCRGIVYRLDGKDFPDSLEALLQTEPPIRPRWIQVETDSGRVSALAFAVDRKFGGYCGNLPDALVAKAIANAVGKLGSMAAYVRSTVMHLEEVGMCDDRLWRIQEMVAAEIEAAYPDRFPERSTADCRKGDG
jgi:cation transport protein ChaC